jgi:hypothetical protein
MEAMLPYVLEGAVMMALPLCRCPPYRGHQPWLLGTLLCSPLAGAGFVLRTKVAAMMPDCLQAAYGLIPC